MGLTNIDGVILKKMFISGANELNKNKQLVDSLNVFPVPDGDTGTNMSLTALAAARECEANSSVSLGQVAKSISNGSLRGARGNSGVILSQLIRGFAKALEDKESADSTEIAQAIVKGVETAYKAVMKPKEGTILTVAKACGESAQKNVLETDDISELLLKIIEDGNAMLAKTTDMLPALKQANVVDAGGKGLMCILEGAYKSLGIEGDLKVDAPLETKAPDFSALTSVDTKDITFGYCTEFFINVENPQQKTVSELKTYLSSIGDSLVVVDNEEIIKVHVHTDHPGQAIEKALTIGSLSGLKIDNMREQHTQKIDFTVAEDFAPGTKEVIEDKKELEEINEIQEVKEISEIQEVKEISEIQEVKEIEEVKEINEFKQIEEIKETEEKKETGFVAISAGEGLNKVFKSLGVDKIIYGGQTMNPSTEDIINAIEKVNAYNVIVLPNNKNIILAAEQASKLIRGKKVVVIPTTSIPEGITAMINNDKTSSVDDMVAAMNESIKTVTTAMVTYAVRETSLGDKTIDEGDILGMLGGNIEVVSKSLARGTKDLLKAAVEKDSEVITIYYGNNVKKEDADEITEFAEKEFPDCEVELVDGGQSIYYYIISVE